MKTIFYSPLLIILFSIILFGCDDHRFTPDQGEKRLLTKIDHRLSASRFVYDLKYSTTSKPTSLTMLYTDYPYPVYKTQIFKYDESDRLSQYTLSSSLGSGSGLYRYNYDANGRLISKIATPNSDVNKKAWEEIYSYDDQDRVSLVTNFHYLDEHLTHSLQYSDKPFYIDETTYEYDSRDNPIIITFKRILPSGTLIYSSKSLLTHDDKPNPLYGFDIVDQDSFPFRSISPNNILKVITDEQEVTYEYEYSDGLPISMKFIMNKEVYHTQFYTYEEK